MILSYKNNPINIESIKFKKRIQYSDDYIYIPIQYNGKDILIQTPDMFIPFPLKTYTCNKKYLDLSFQKLSDDFIHDFLNVFYEKTYTTYSKNYEIDNFIKESKTSKWMRFKVDDSCLFFNQEKEKINEIISKTYGSFIIHLNGLWIVKNKIWFQWTILQAKVKIPIQI